MGGLLDRLRGRRTIAPLEHVGLVGKHGTYHFGRWNEPVWVQAVEGDELLVSNVDGDLLIIPHWRFRLDANQTTSRH